MKFLKEIIYNQKIKWWYFFVLSIILLYLNIGLITNFLFLIFFIFSLIKFFKNYKKNKINLFFKIFLIIISFFVFIMYSLTFYLYLHQVYINNATYVEFKKLPDIYQDYGYEKCFDHSTLTNFLIRNQKDCCLSVIVDMAGNDMLPYNGGELPECDGAFCGAISPMCNGSISFYKNPDSKVVIKDIDDCIKLKGEKSIIDPAIRSNVSGKEITEDDFNEDTESYDKCVLDFVNNDTEIMDVVTCDKIQSNFYKKSCIAVIEERNSKK